jgi:hypothetical protein
MIKISPPEVLLLTEILLNDSLPVKVFTIGKSQWQMQTHHKSHHFLTQLILKE